MVIREGMGERGEGGLRTTYQDEHWVMYSMVELLDYCILENNIILYVNYTTLELK